MLHHTCLLQVEEAKKQRDGQPWPAEDREALREKIRQRSGALLHCTSSFMGPHTALMGISGSSLQHCSSSTILELNSVNDTHCRYDKEGHPAFASARLWDDGILDPADTRRVLGLSLAAAQHSPLSPVPHYGVFRM